MGLAHAGLETGRNLDRDLPEAIKQRVASARYPA